MSGPALDREYVLAHARAYAARVLPAGECTEAACEAYAQHYADLCEPGYYPDHSPTFWTWYEDLATREASAGPRAG